MKSKQQSLWLAHTNTKQKNSRVSFHSCGAVVWHCGQGRALSTLETWAFFLLRVACFRFFVLGRQVQALDMRPTRPHLEQNSRNGFRHSVRRCPLSPQRQQTSGKWTATCFWCETRIGRGFGSSLSVFWLDEAAVKSSSSSGQSSISSA